MEKCVTGLGQWGYCCVCHEGFIIGISGERMGRADWLTLLLLSYFSHVWLCVTPQTAAHQAPPSLGFSRQEHWSGLPFPSPMHESEKWKWSVWLFATPWTAAYQAPPSMVWRPLNAWLRNGILSLRKEGTMWDFKCGKHNQNDLFPISYWLQDTFSISHHCLLVPELIFIFPTSTGPAIYVSDNKHSSLVQRLIPLGSIFDVCHWLQH